MSTDTENDAARERWAKAPRPLAFIRLRVHRGGPAEYLHSLLEDEKSAEMENLTEYRTKGLAEDSTEVDEARMNLRYLIAFLRDLDSGLVDMLGPDPTP